MAVGALAFCRKETEEKGMSGSIGILFVASRLSKGAGLSVYRGKTQKEKV